MFLGGTRLAPGQPARPPLPLAQVPNLIPSHSCNQLNSNSRGSLGGMLDWDWKPGKACVLVGSARGQGPIARHLVASWTLRNSGQWFVEI